MLRISFLIRFFVVYWFQEGGVRVMIGLCDFRVVCHDSFFCTI